MHLQRLGIVLIRILEFNANCNIPCLNRRDTSRKKKSDYNGKARNRFQYIPVGLEPIFCQIPSSFVSLCVHFKCPLVSIKGGKVFQGKDCQLSFKIKEGRETDGGEKAGWFPVWS